MTNTTKFLLKRLKRSIMICFCPKEKEKAAFFPGLFLGTQQGSSTVETGGRILQRSQGSFLVAPWDGRETDDRNSKKIKLGVTTHQKRGLLP